MRLLAPQLRKFSILSHNPPQKAIPTAMVTHLLFSHLKQSVPPAPQVQPPHTANPRHTEFTALLGIKPCQHHSVPSQKSSKANIMVLIHRMPECNTPILIHVRRRHSMGFVCCLYSQRLQLSSAAVDACPGKCFCVKFRSFRKPSSFPIFSLLTTWHLALFVSDQSVYPRFCPIAGNKPLMIERFLAYSLFSCNSTFHLWQFVLYC